MGKVERYSVLWGSDDFPNAYFVWGIEIGKGWTDDCAVGFFNNTSTCIYNQKNKQNFMNMKTQI